MYNLFNIILHQVFDLFKWEKFGSVNWFEAIVIITTL